MQNLAPIVLFAYNRPLHTKKTLDALANNHGADESTLYIFCDGAKETAGDEQKKKIVEVREIANRENRFKEVIVREQPENKGLAASIVAGVTEVVNKYGKIIVLEDDLVTSPDFLDYMNEALELYQDHPQVACISGYIYPVKGKLPEAFFVKGADCWGWATWKEKWKLFEPDGQKLLNQLETQSLGTEFDFGNTYPYMEMLRDQINKKNDSWAIRWYASAFLSEQYCLYPGISLVENIGTDGSGTHSGYSDQHTGKMADKKPELKPVSHIADDQQALSLFRKYFKTLKREPSLIHKMKTKAKRIIKAAIRK